MHRLARYVEKEFEKNSELFTIAETNMIASMEFIDFVLLDENLTLLNDQERQYVYTMKKSFDEMRILLSNMREAIEHFKDAYYDFFFDYP